METNEPAAYRLSSIGVASGLVLASVRPGQVVFHLPLSPGQVSADGRVGEMVLSVATEIALGVAVYSMRPGEWQGVVAELCIDHAGPVGVGASRLEIVGEALGTGSGTGTSRAVIRDDTGVVVAHATGMAAIDQVAAPASPEEPSAPPFDPGAIRVLPVDADTARAEIRPDMLNARGSVHGGVLLGLVHEAQELFRRGAEGHCRPLRVAVEYLRPAPAAGQLVFRSSFVRRGRRVWIMSTTVLDAAGKTVAVAQSTCAVTERSSLEAAVAIG